MDDKSIVKILSGESKDIQNLKNHLEIVKDFLVLVNRIDALPEANRRLEGISPFQAVVRNVPVQKLEGFLIAFFGAPVKRAGEPGPFKLKFDPAVKYLGEIRIEQTFFVRKVKNGEFYGAIWPWVRKPEFQTLHLGYYSKTLSDDDFQKLEELIRKSTHQRLVGEMEAGIGGQIHGISLPAFLQMSEMEKTTATLKIISENRTGLLFLKNGNLIDAKTGQHEGRKAAYHIISWDNASIEINKAVPEKPNVIKEPLMHVLMESLKIKDEKEFQKLEKESAGEIPTDGTGDEKAGQEEEDFSEPEQVEDADDMFAKKSVGKRTFIQKWRRDPEKKRILKIAAVACVLILLISIGSFFTVRMINSSRLKNKYQALLEEVEKQTAFKEKEILLKLFINSSKSDEYAQKARKKLAEIKTRMDEQLYQQVIKNVKALPLTFDYDKKAKVYYNQYLEQFPDGKYVSKIKEGIAGIPEIIDDTQFNHLTNTQWKNEDEKIIAHKEYLINHPNGKHRKAVEHVLVEIIEARYSAIQKETSVCEEKNDWASCIQKCDHFLAFFDNTYRTGKVKKLRDSFQGKQDLNRLRQAALKKGEDYPAAKKIYKDYLEAHPDSTIRDVISEEVMRLDELIEIKDNWQEVLTYCQDPENDIADKIAKTDKFIDDHRSGPYYNEARDMLAKLHQEKLEYDKKRAIELEQARKAERLKNEMLAKQKQKARLDRETRRVGERLKTAGGRYKNNGNGTFTDRNTGLTWCILDSNIVLGKCIDYKTAVKYVNGLSTGGYTDWRLPTSSELAQIYKHEPFYPTDGPRWFWTSEVVVKGYHEMVGIVTSKQETVFTRDFLNTKECGTVHAVRP